MVGMKHALLLLVASCVLAQPDADVLYMHNKEACSEPSSESKYPFCNWHYLVYAPRIFRAGVDEKVLLSTSNIDFDVTFTTTFKSGRNFKVSSSNVVKPGVLTEAILKIPHNAPSSGYIEVGGIAKVPKGTNGIEQDSGWAFYNKTSTIQVHRTSSQVYIQTDRPIYKPGETIRIRVLSVDSNLKAVTGVISKMAVLNPSRTTMRQWRNVKLQGGFASFKLKLSIKPVLGLWRVEATVKGKRKTIYIKVEKYVLPKFQVTIKPPSYIANGEAKADGEFCAKYSYGKDVSGVLRAKICAYFPRYWNYRSYSYSSDKEICDNIVKKISGCQPFEMDLKFFKINDYKGYRRPSFTFEASVKEGATGITLNATKVDMTVHKNNVELTFKGTPDIFKPALPFEAWVYAKRPDGSPVDSIDVKIRVRNGDYRSVHKEVIKIRGGKGKVNLPKVPLQTKRLRFVATYQPKSFPQRRARSSVPYTGGRSSSVNAYHTANAWYSPSHSYIAITKEDKVYKPGTDAKFTVKYTTYGDEKVKRNVFYALMCKGTVALSGVVPTEFAAATENSRPKRSVDEDGDEIPPFEDDDDDDDVPPEDDTVTTEIKTPKMTTVEMTTPETTTPEMTTPEMTTPEMTTPEMTTPEMTTPEMTTPEMTTPGMTTPEMTTESPPATTTTAPPPLRLFTQEEIWLTRPRGPATRAPLPKDLSVGSFDFGFRVTADMTPSCRMLVYYIKDRETVADSIVVQTGNSFANEVSMKFNQKQVFPGTKVNLTLKASPGSRFAISAVDKSVHFLREANDLKSGQVLDVLKRLDIGPGYISDYDRCKSRHWYYYYSESKYVDSQKAFNTLITRK